MKKLFVVRHGDYDDDNRLNEHGKKQIRELAKIVQADLNGYSVLILSSSAPRASDSAEAMDEVLKVGFEENKVFWYDSSHWSNPDDAHKAIMEKKDDADVIIVITHLDFTEDIPGIFMNELGIDAHCCSVGKGQAWKIDLENRTMQRISP